MGPCVGAVVVASALAAGCGGSGSGSGGGSGGGTGLTAALSRISDTSDNRSQVLYDDTAGLVALTGSQLGGTGYGQLTGMGTGNLVEDYQQLQSQAGISVLGESYAISAGPPPQTVGVLAGGQNASQVTKDLTQQGWKQHGARLVMLPLNLSNNLDAQTGGELSQVQPGGSDVIFGAQQADLSQAGSPSGQTLAQDPVISALASCLGNVAAAGFFSGYQGPVLRPAEVAVGVTTPASKTAVPHAVVCAAWATSSGASQYAANVTTALSSGVSPTLNEQWSKVVRQPSVTSVGGGQHVVRWQAETPQGASLVFNLVDSANLPALPDCSRIPPSAQAQVIGC